MTGRRTAIVVSSALVVIAAAFATGLVVILRDAPKRQPQITAYAAGRAVQVGPCETQRTDCTHWASTDLEVPPGDTLQLSLPAELSRGLWVLQPVYADANREEPEPLPAPVVYRKGTSAVTWPTEKTGPRLVGIEIRQPTAIAGELRLLRVWSIKTG